MTKQNEQKSMHLGSSAERSLTCVGRPWWRVLLPDEEEAARPSTPYELLSELSEQERFDRLLSLFERSATHRLLDNPPQI